MADYSYVCDDCLTKEAREDSAGSYGDAAITSGNRGMEMRDYRDHGGPLPEPVVCERCRIAFICWAI